MEQILDVGSAVEAVSADVVSTPLLDLECLCLHCGAENATTRFFFTSIPHFREIMLSSFYCPHCGDRNNGVMFIGKIHPRRCCHTLEIPSGNPKMLNRQVVKSESATVKIPELVFEIQPEARRGSLSTVEGILTRAAEDLETHQEERKKVAPEAAEAIDQFLPKLRACASGESSFTFVLDDPAGNSFIENPFAPSSDPSLTMKFFDRTPEEQEWLKYQLDSTQIGGTPDEALSGVEAGVSDQVKRELNGSVGAPAGRRAIAQSHSAEIAEALFQYSEPENIWTFPSTCYDGCASGCETRMFKTNIPYFKEVIVMASTCDSCGYRSSELKDAGGIAEKGKRITLHVKNIIDLSRDVIKSNVASVEVPELDLKHASGTGVVTTVEGLITKISENFDGLTFGDSIDEDRRSKWLDFGARLNKLLSLEKPWTLILDDASANSFIAPATDYLKDDEQLMIKEYERTWEQNEELGVNGMDTSSADVAYESEEC